MGPALEPRLSPHILILDEPEPRGIPGYQGQGPPDFRSFERAPLF